MEQNRNDRQQLYSSKKWDLSKMALLAEAKQDMVGQDKKEMLDSMTDEDFREAQTNGKVRNIQIKKKRSPRPNIKPGSTQHSRLWTTGMA